MRKIRITVLALALAALCTATALAAGTQAVGDVNGSGDVNMTDMQCLYDLLSTDKYSGSLTDEAGRRAADINGDGTVDILDYQRLYDILRQQVDYDNPVYEYDENGRMIRKCYYDATGKVNRYLVYEYGADGRKSAAVCYNADGSVRYNCKIEYRADDWAEWTYYDPETNKVLGVDMDDANGVLRQSTEYDPATGKVTCVWEYDETGTLRKSTEYDTDTGKAAFVREFDEKERMVDCKGYENGILSFHWTAVYDEDGIETRTCYDPATNKVTWIEIRDANGTLRKFTEYNTDTGKVVCVQEFDEKERMVDYKEFSGDTLAFHWTAVYDEDGIETRTYYDAATGKVTCIEIRDANGTRRKSTEYDTDTGKAVRVQEYDENGAVRKCTCYDRETGEILFVSEFDEQEREIGFKEFNNGTLSCHWMAVYDESGAEIRTYYDTVTGSASNIEKREYDWTNKTCTITQYDVQTDKMNRVQVWEMNGEGDWKLIKTTDYGKVVCVWEYDENGVVRKYTSYDRETGEILSVSEFDEQGREIGFKEFNNGTLSSHWTAVYDESGIETRTCYDAATGKVTGIEIRDANGTLRKYTRYDRETGEILSVSEFDEQGREIGFKEFNNGTLSFHCTAVYDESGAEIRTYYDTVTGSVSNIEKREYDRTNKTCTITQYDVQTGKKYCVAVYDMSDQNNWTLKKEITYDENGNITSEKEY